MDLRTYYQKIREVVSTIGEDFAVVASLETPDGGREGVLTEVTRQQAAKLIVERRARAATAAEASSFQREKEEKFKAAEDLAAASRLQLTVVSDKTYRLLDSKAPANKKQEA